MENVEFKNSKAFKVADILEYLPHSVVIKSIVRKTTGYVSAVSFDSGEALIGKISPFDTFIQIIEGNAEIIIDGQSNLMEMGESIIIPGHSSNTIKAHQRFKMLSTTIKHGYEDITL